MMNVKIRTSMKKGGTTEVKSDDFYSDDLNNEIGCRFGRILKKN